MTAKVQLGTQSVITPVASIIFLLFAGELSLMVAQEGIIEIFAIFLFQLFLLIIAPCLGLYWGIKALRKQESKALSVTGITLNSIYLACSLVILIVGTWIWSYIEH